MQLGQAAGSACLSFLITNIDDAFVLITFFAESASRDSSLTPWKIVVGHRLAFSACSPFSSGFLLGLWKFFELVLPIPDAGDGEDSEDSKLFRARGLRAVAKVASITLINGGDNIGTYIPLFSQVERVGIAVYAVVYYVLLGVWCLCAWLLIRQRHVARLAEKYVGVLVPFLYVGLGIYIVVQSDAYPWLIERIDNEVPDARPGRAILASVTVFLILVCVVAMALLNRSRRIKAALAAQPALEPEADIRPEMVPGTAHDKSTSSQETAHVSSRPGQSNQNGS
ncbi:cadmium resistance transporter-domain-containing protein [Microdochium trichocladiopsis]|uniref:Cadmium resistance transporter-domain-containing protein n=1 Tax=Microdochium trichocladiopsis TaxID=1682393 RepID=A0A9P8YAE9_9PEZI|nr:cadmium resistance transporter-domain-containing protein [Microdochium trichocladiopsis]KAH7033710.1 cadmium resistance transporter-domain-containing protein [Microdochium trichocladiopsis]